jgi:hypothetical protein
MGPGTLAVATSREDRRSPRSGSGRADSPKSVMAWVLSMAVSDWFALVHRAWLGGVPGVRLLLPFFGEKLESSFAFGFIGYYFLCQQTKTFHVLASEELVHDALHANVGAADQIGCVNRPT